jgi:hypothetical protein
MQNWIEVYVHKWPVWARKQVKDAETAIMIEQEDMENVEKAGSATRQPETAFGKMLYAIRDSLSDLATSKDEEDVSDDTEYEDD